MSHNPTWSKGIDVSVWNGDITKALVGQQFAFCRASIGGDADGSYPTHSASVLKAGCVLGAYHYLVYGPGPTRQANIFYKTSLNAQILALDMESTALRYPATAKSFIINLRKLDIVRKRPILLYSSEGTWPGYMGQDANWVANYRSTPPGIHWLFWQYQGSPLDRDVFNGTLAELKAFVKV